MANPFADMIRLNTAALNVATAQMKDFNGDPELPFETDLEGIYSHKEDADKLRIYAHGLQENCFAWEDHIGKVSDDVSHWAVSFDSNRPWEMAKTYGEFVEQVQEFTGIEDYDAVAHSLGGLAVHEYFEDTDNLPENAVLLGSPFDGSRLGVGFLDSESEYLDRFDSTVEDVEVYTVRGSDDPSYRSNPESPLLDGANVIDLEESHHGIRDSEEAVQLVDEILQRPYQQ
ncbi:MAG: hypothetical protein H8Z69_05500 [Nanohaloarchaea archaeon]|nr:hypothetical protein [Candidatus Nanohaloarchaea archaeon]